MQALIRRLFSIDTLIWEGREHLLVHPTCSLFLYIRSIFGEEPKLVIDFDLFHKSPGSSAALRSLRYIIARRVAPIGPRQDTIMMEDDVVLR